MVLPSGALAPAPYCADCGGLNCRMGFCREHLPCADGGRESEIAAGLSDFHAWYRIGSDFSDLPETLRSTTVCSWVGESGRILLGSRIPSKAF